MGGLCCCLGSDSFEDYVGSYQNGRLYQQCSCIRCCMRWFLSTQYTTSFDEVEHEEISPPNQGVSTSGAGGNVGGSNLDNWMPDAFQAPPQPLPYDSDPRYLRGSRDGLVSRRDKSGVSHLNVGEAEPLRHSNSNLDGGGTAMQRRTLNNGGVDHEGQVQGFKIGDPEKRAPSSKDFPRVESNLSILDDEDICATCLDGYTEENPRIHTDCGHHFHLACIYEWMERSKQCPICDKEMVFSESL